MKIAFASCCKLAMDSSQIGWTRIANDAPELLLLLGDNVYLRRNNILRAATLEKRLDDAYRAQLAVPSFKQLTETMKSRRGVLATWDDHDSFGNNRYGLGGEHVKAATRSFLRHMTFGATRTTVHTSRDFDSLVRVIMLDVRSFRQSPEDDRSENAMLGKAQWDWLCATLSDPNLPKFVFVGSGTCFYGDYTDQEESWEDYPAAAARLTSLLAKPGHVLLSGDIHQNAIGGLGAKGKILELVSSGIARRAKQNYGILEVAGDSAKVELVDKTGTSLTRTLSLGAWPNA